MVDRHPVCHQPGIVVGYSNYGHILVMEMNLAWWWLMGVVAFLVLVGYLLQSRRNDQSSRGTYCLNDRLLLDPLFFFANVVANNIPSSSVAPVSAKL